MKSVLAACLVFSAVLAFTSVAHARAWRVYSPVVPTVTYYPATTYVTSVPVTPYYGEPVTTYYSEPVTTYYAPVTTYIAPVRTYYGSPRAVNRAIRRGF